MQPLLNRNYATDPEILAVAKRELCPLVKRVRNDRVTFRETLLRYLRIWSVTRDVQSYQGRSQTYIPIGRKLIENWVKRILRDLFPDNNPFDVRALRMLHEKRVPLVRALQTHFITKHARLRRFSGPMVRQLVTLGTSPVKQTWALDERDLHILREILDEEGEGTGRWDTRIEKVVQRIGPTFRPVDLFAWYVFPTTVADVEDAELTFEDLLLSRERVKELGKKPIHPDDDSFGHVYEHVEKILERPSQDSEAREKFNAEARRMADKGFTHVLDLKIPQELRPVDVTEGIWRRDLLGKGRAQRFLFAIGGDDEVLRLQENPFWHGQNMTLAGKFVEVENEFYGRGLPELFDRLQYLATDIADQANDALTWSMNPIAIVDAFQVQDPNSIRMRPGAKWLASINGVKFAEPPKESAVIGFQALSQISGMIREVGDVAPVGAPGGRGRGRQQPTAAGAQLLISEAAVDVREVVQNLEESVYTPWLYRAHTLTQQFLDRKLVLQIAGIDGVSMVEQQIGVADIVGDFEFQWLGSLQALNQQVRSQQMVQAIGIFTKLPKEQLEAQNVEIDWKFILRDLWSTGLGLRNGERIIRDKVRQESIDWRIENELFRLDRGAEVTVSQADNDLEHAQGHQPLLERPGLTPSQQQQVFSHLQAHVAAHLAKQMLAKQQQAQQTVGNGPPPGGGGGNGTRLAPPLGPGRLRQAGDVSDLFRSLPRGTV